MNRDELVINFKDDMREIFREHGLQGLKDSLRSAELFVIAEMDGEDGGIVVFEGWPDGEHPVRIEFEYFT